MSAANKVPPDSVKGLILISNNFKDFPKEIFRFKNLQYIEIGTYLWGQVLDSLTPKQRKKYIKLEKKVCDRCTVMKYYKPNIIKNIPKEIVDLKQLEVIDCMGTLIKSPCEFKKIYDFLPNQVSIIPDIKLFQELNHNELNKCK